MNRILAHILSLIVIVGVEIPLDRSLAEDRLTGPAADTELRQEWMQRTPYPYTIPIPADIPTAVDGEYVKFEAKKTPPIPCRRCPDYKPEGGWWKVSLRKGVFRIVHPSSGWRSLGTYTIDGHRIRLSNDPVCPERTGTYRWELDRQSLRFTAVEDRCSAGLRAKNLTHLPWQPCNSASSEAVDSDLRIHPEGCDHR